MKHNTYVRVRVHASYNIPAAPNPCVACCKRRHLFQTLADNEDRGNQLTDTLETHKYHFEQAVKVANFPEVSRSSVYYCVVY